MSSPKSTTGLNVEALSPPPPPPPSTSAPPHSPPLDRESSTPDTAGQIAPVPSRLAFTPFFTLLEDVQTSEHHHPTTHYIFSDDSADLITAASLRALDPTPPSQTSSVEGSGRLRAIESENENTEDENKASVLPPRRPGVEDRYLLLDVDETGENVIKAQSFTSDWQVLNVEITNAPTWAGDEGQDPSGGGGLMLKVEGTGGIEDSGKSNKNSHETNIESLLGEFEKRMAVLRKVVGDTETRDKHTEQET